jgi:hypothetical protein
MARITVAHVNARMDEFEARFDRLEALIVANLAPEAPAKTTRKAKPAKKAPKKPATKGAQTRETLSRSDWNHTLTAKARFAGGDTYKRVLADWQTTVTEARNSGMTPDEALALFI